MQITDLIIDIAAKACKVNKEEIPSSSKDWRVVEARQIAILLMFKAGCHYKTIGNTLNRGHVAVYQARTRALRALSVSKVFENFYKEAISMYESESV